MNRGRRRSDEGQVAVFVVVLLVVVLGVSGLVLDATLAFGTKLQLEHVAQGAARAGAGGVDERVLLASSGERVVLDRRVAEQRAHDYLGGTACDCTADVSATSYAVTVSLRKESLTMFSRIIGVDSVTVGARAQSDPINPNGSAR